MEGRGKKREGRREKMRKIEQVRKTGGRDMEEDREGERKSKREGERKKGREMWRKRQ